MPDELAGYQNLDGGTGGQAPQMLPQTKVSHTLIKVLLYHA